MGRGASRIDGDAGADCRGSPRYRPRRSNEFDLLGLADTMERRLQSLTALLPPPSESAAVEDAPQAGEHSAAAEGPVSQAAPAVWLDEDVQDELIQGEDAATDALGIAGAAPADVAKQDEANSEGEALEWSYAETEAARQEPAGALHADADVAANLTDELSAPLPAVENFGHGAETAEEQPSAHPVEAIPAPTTRPDTAADMADEPATLSLEQIEAREFGAQVLGAQVLDDVAAWNADLVGTGDEGSSDGHFADAMLTDGKNDQDGAEGIATLLDEPKFDPPQETDLLPDDLPARPDDGTDRVQVRTAADFDFDEDTIAAAHEFELEDAVHDSMAEALSPPEVDNAVSPGVAAWVEVLGHDPVHEQSGEQLEPEPKHEFEPEQQPADPLFDVDLFETQERHDLPADAHGPATKPASWLGDEAHERLPASDLTTPSGADQTEQTPLHSAEETDVDEPEPSVPLTSGEGDDPEPLIDRLQAMRSAIASLLDEMAAKKPQQ